MAEPDAAVSPSAQPASPRREHTHPIFVLANSRYRLLWTSAFVAMLGQQCQRVVALYLVWEFTHEPFMLGLLGAFQVVPLLLFSLAGGSLADIFDRKKLLVLTQCVRVGIGALLLMLEVSGQLNVWYLYAATFLLTAGGVMERPAQQAMLPALVPRRQVTSAILLNSVNNQSSRTIGPAIAGLLLASQGVAPVYGLYLIFAIASAFLALRLPSAIAIRENEAPPNVWKMMGEGLRFMLDTRVILALLLLDSIATFFGAFEPLMPVFADDVLHVGPQGLGMLLAATGFGAVLGVLTVLNFTWVKRKGRVVLAALFGYGLALIGFGLSPIFALSLFFVALLGALDQVNVTFRNTVLLLITPDQLRGRIESIRMLFIVGAPALGAMQAGAIASVIGAPFTITTEAFFVLAGVLFVGRRVREVREIEL